jgi:hypothetical protein
MFVGSTPGAAFIIVDVMLSHVFSALFQSFLSTQEAEMEEHITTSHSKAHQCNFGTILQPQTQ